MKLISLHAELFFANQEERPYPINFMLTFNDHKPLRLRGSGQGDTLIIENEPLQPPHEWEDGRVVHQDVIMLVYPSLHLLEIDRIEAILRGDDQIGVSLISSSEPTFHIWVDDDEFYWGNDQSLQWHWRRIATPLRLGGRLSVAGD